MRNFLFIVIFLLFVFHNAKASDDVVGTPVMSPGLNAYVYELGEKQYKAMFNTGVMQASYATKGVGHLIIGGSFSISELSIFETGIYANFSLDGRNENIINSGVDLKLHFTPIKFLDILYIKTGIGYLRFHSGNLIGRGLETPYGIGMQLATGQSTLVTLEYVRRPVFFVDGPSIWNIMLSVGYAW